ncbi:MAG TPA: tRNA (adenosine(37)-N6)-dimethylallyltransferase MiaA [Bryobacteraceae bacterium]|nr:tRNA (adenosine(37)-N6)-dimethylallyltransferase MiaA [Bryobacteraceae bacterium]
MNTVVVVAGPTASGKSDIALDLAEFFGGEIVNCDSVQLYRYMDIGTAKTPVSQRRGIPHHLIDILDPDDIFTAGDYQRNGRAALAEIASRGRLPVVVGGTGFYLRALLHGLFDGPARNDELRARLARRKPGSLHRLLSHFDPVAASHIHAHDTNKLIRALEVRLLTRQPITSLYAHNREPLQGFRVLQIGLDPPRDQLARQIDERCARMYLDGLVTEVQQIVAMGYSRDAKSLQSIGYREAMACLDGKMSMTEALERTQAATRQYAKRQRTWFRRDPDITWFQAFGNQLETSEAIKRHVGARLNR